MKARKKHVTGDAKKGSLKKGKKVGGNRQERPTPPPKLFEEAKKAAKQKLKGVRA